jgi:hypothetical protein
MPFALNTQDHFRGIVEQGVGLEEVLAFPHLPGEPEVAQPDVAVLQQHQVLGSQILVDDAFAMEILKTEHDAP